MHCKDKSNGHGSSVDGVHEFSSYCIPMFLSLEMGVRLYCPCGLWKLNYVITYPLCVLEIIIWDYKMGGVYMADSGEVRCRGLHERD